MKGLNPGDMKKLRAGSAGATAEADLIAAVGEATIRLRMGGEDAHYAGGLVDGARMLKLFGDVATELLIRLDGDEGLFRAYDAVEFLAPARAGDYIEARGTITAIGKSSRKMKFEAYRVIQAITDAGAAVSAAEVLTEPVLVCRATGTCVTPIASQRFAPST